MIIRCIAVDDEPLSLRIIEKYAAQVPRLQLVATCNNAFEAMEVLRLEPVDLMFLDINMPKLSGISLLKTLDRPPQVIFTTAYPQYAVEGFELEAVDYLLKPFSFERFAKAVNRAAERQPATRDHGGTQPDHILIRADKKIYKIDCDDLLYLEAFGDYVKVHTREKMLLTKERLGTLEQNLPDSLFQRIHRSYIIAIQKIDYVEGNSVNIAKAKLPVSQSFKDALMSKLGGG
ncbi:MAG: LytR/AlgR family response regulator transcription factor [Saprospiraceae bacterium]